MRVLDAFSALWLVNWCEWGVGGRTYGEFCLSVFAGLGLISIPTDCTKLSKTKAAYNAADGTTFVLSLQCLDAVIS